MEEKSHSEFYLVMDSVYYNHDFLGIMLLLMPRRYAFMV